MNHKRGTLRLRRDPKPWNHQSELVRMVGKDVCVHMLHEPKIVEARLINADAFTIHLRLGEMRDRIIFKHAVAWVSLAGAV